MLPKVVTDARSGHRGQVTKGQNMNPTMLGSCDVIHVAPQRGSRLSVAALTELLVILQRSGIASGSISFLPAPDQSVNMQAEF